MFGVSAVFAVAAFTEIFGSPVFVGYDNQKEESSDYYVSTNNLSKIRTIM